MLLFVNKVVILAMNLCTGFIWNYHILEMIKAASTDDFKCSLPDITSNITDLDLSSFRKGFDKISEIKFPGIVGPLNERIVCKIKCIDGNWVGPLCSTAKDGRFHPLFRECVYNSAKNPLLILSFSNSTIENGTVLAHGSVVAVRCKEFGVYKLNGDSLTRCHNGEWLPKLPGCVPTTLLTNFTGGAPPSIIYKLVGGSAWVSASGELWLYPESSVHLECVSRRTELNPVWSWTGMVQYPADWSPIDEERETRYRLILANVSTRHSDQYTCTAPNGETNTITAKVVSVVCPQLEVTNEHVIQSNEGFRLGQSIHLNCKLGFQLHGSAMLTCSGSGRWSAQPPTCIEANCPMLKWPSPHLSLIEYNSSVGGRAVFQCAWGYRIVGAPGIKCNQEGRWIGKPPTCSAVYCPRSIVPVHGYVVGGTDDRHSVGDLIVYGCSERRKLVGEASVVCTESGFWSHPPPFCIEAYDNTGDNNATDWDVTTPDTIYVDNTTLVQFQFS